MFGIGSIILKKFSFSVIRVRLFHGVFHNPNRHIFYVKLNEKDRAVLLYKQDGKIMDMQSINVPSNYQGRGLARTLAEAALTYAIVHDYKIILSCKYMQKYYLATKNRELEERVIGPSNIIEGPESSPLHPEIIDELPDPQDTINPDLKD